MKHAGTVQLGSMQHSQCEEHRQSQRTEDTHTLSIWKSHLSGRGLRYSRTARVFELSSPCVR